MGWLGPHGDLVAWCRASCGFVRALTSEITILQWRVFLAPNAGYKVNDVLEALLRYLWPRWRSRCQRNLAIFILISQVEIKTKPITVPFDWEFHQGIKFTCCTLLSFVAEQRLSSRVSYSVAAWMSALLRQWTFGFEKNRFFSFRVVHFCHFLKFWCQIFKILVSNCCFG